MGQCQLRACVVVASHYKPGRAGVRAGLLRRPSQGAVPLHTAQSLSCPQLEKEDTKPTCSCHLPVPRPPTCSRGGGQSLTETFGLSY